MNNFIKRLYSYSIKCIQFDENYSYRIKTSQEITYSIHANAKYLEFKRFCRSWMIRCNRLSHSKFHSSIFDMIPSDVITFDYNSFKFQWINAYL